VKIHRFGLWYSLQIPLYFNEYNMKKGYYLLDKYLAIYNKYYKKIKINLIRYQNQFLW